jgi:LuxR family maltose regulon positive regulatory protein
VSGLGSLGVLEAWQGNLRLAEQLADEAFAIATQVGSLGHPSTAEAFLTRALVAHSRGEHAAAADAFQEGLLRTTLNGRSQLLWVCICIAAMIGFPAPVDQPATPAPPIVAEKLDAEAARRRLHVNLPEELTDRELQILSYMPSRLSKNEIAELCFVSVNTVKTHMAHIYRKLGVTDRDAAVAAARELGLLV